MVGLGLVGAGCQVQHVVNYSQGDRFSPLDWGILDIVGFELPDEALVDTGVSL